MFKNEYLEKCLKNQEGSYYLLNGYEETVHKKYDKLVVEDLGFIYRKPDEVKLFKDELVKAGIKEFIIVEGSTALMAILHALSTVGIKIEELAKVEYINAFSEKTEVKQGIKMIVE